MSRTHELGWPKLRIQWPSGGRWAWNWQYLDKHARTYSVANAYEIDHPYRGSRSVVLRLAGTRGIVFHHWETNPESLEDDGNGRWVEHHLARALSCQKGSQRFQDSVTIDDELLEIHVEDEPDHSPLCEDLDCPGNGGPQRATEERGEVIAQFNSWRGEEEWRTSAYAGKACDGIEPPLADESCQKGSQRFQDSVTVDDEELDIHMEIYDTEDVPFPAPEGFDWVPTDTIKAWLAGKSDYTPPVQSPVYHNNDEDWYDW